jgi:AbrB family looped-hinge helix DNA binding protein
MERRPSSLEYLTTVKIGEKGQLTVPKQLRDELGLRAGAPVAILRMGNGLILLPGLGRFEQLCGRVSSNLTDAGLTPEAFLATLPGARKRVYERQYGSKGSVTASCRRSAKQLA